MFRKIYRIWHQWLEKRRQTELEHVQERLTQEQWRSSLEKHSHEADLAAGYGLNHFNSMQ